MKKSIVVVFCVLTCGLMFAGCSNSTITFNRESGFSKMMDNINGSSGPTVKKSSGLMIYRDNTKTGTADKNVNFDINVKF